MFFIMNRGRIISVAVALTMVLVLFLLANSFRTNVVKTVDTSANMTTNTNQTANFNTYIDEH